MQQSRNNDGCAVARSNEAKALGIKMGVPLFQIKDIVQKHNVQVLSSNYALYAEMSRRFHKILGQYVTESEQEIYSIDECFLDLSAYYKNYDLTKYGQDMRQKILKWIGLPVCVGIGKSKTEAKIANHIAKKNPSFNGVCDLVNMDLCNKEYYLAQIEVSEVWGVGRKHSKKLQTMNINTVLDLASADPREMQKRFSIVMARTVAELQGISCIEIEHTPPCKKQIVASRSFGSRVANFKSNNVEIHVTIETESSFTKPSICMSIYTNNDLDKSDPFRYINRFYINGSRDYSRFHPCSISAMEAIECLDKTAGDYKFNLNDWSDRFESFDSELPF